VTLFPCSFIRISLVILKLIRALMCVCVIFFWHPPKKNNTYKQHLLFTKQVMFVSSWGASSICVVFFVETQYIKQIARQRKKNKDRGIRRLEGNGNVFFQSFGSLVNVFFPQLKFRRRFIQISAPSTEDGWIEANRGDHG